MVIDLCCTTSWEFTNKFSHFWLLNFDSANHTVQLEEGRRFHKLFCDNHILKHAFYTHIQPAKQIIDPNLKHQTLKLLGTT